MQIVKRTSFIKAEGIPAYRQKQKYVAVLSFVNRNQNKRDQYKVLRDIVINHIGAEAWKDSFSTKEDIAQLIIDCIRFSNLIGARIAHSVACLASD